MENNNYKGYALFNDIEDVALRNRNRAVVLTNLADDHKTKEGKIKPQAASLIIGYFSKVPEADRQDVRDRFEIEMAVRGFKIV